MTNVTPANGLDLGDGVKLSWAPLDSAGAAITGAAASITLTIKEPGIAAITKTSGDLTEASGTYSYVHKTTVVGRTKGKWVYDVGGNSDGVEQFYYEVSEVEV